MEVFLNILIIVLAIIAFLLLFIVFSKIEQERKRKNNPPLNKGYDFETGEELYIEMKNNTTENLNGKDNYMIEKQQYQLPEKYNKTFIRLFFRDPNFLYTYWEVNKQEFYNHHPILRLIDEDFNNYSDIEINHKDRSWYISSIKSNNRYKVAIGYLKDGIFYPLAYSNTITTATNRPSDIIDEHWMTIDELSRYSYRVNMDTIALIKTIEERKLAEEGLKADSYNFTQEKKSLQQEKKVKKERLY